MKNTIIHNSLLSKFKKKQIEEFSENGFTILRNFLTKDKIKEINKDLKIFIKKNTKIFISREINLVKKNKINSLHNLKNFIHAKNLKKDDDLKFIAEKLLDEKVEDMGSELFAKPAKHGLKSPVHQDNFYWC